MRRRIVCNPSLPLLFTLEKAVYLKINVIFHKSWARSWNFQREARHRNPTPSQSPTRHVQGKHIYLLVSRGNYDFIQLMWDKKKVTLYTHNHNIIVSWTNFTEFRMKRDQLKEVCKDGLDNDHSE